MRAAEGSCARGSGVGGVSWGPEAPAVSLRGEGNREGQEGNPSGKQESHGEGTEQRRKDHASGTTSC